MANSFAEKLAEVTRLQAAAKRRAHKRMGAAMEERAMLILRALGLVCVEQIHTGTRTVRGRIQRTGKVLGDIRAVNPFDGRAVLCEVKYRADNMLSLSDFEPHQIKALDAYKWHGAIPLVAFACPLGLRVMAWPIAAKHGHPMDFHDAAFWELLPRATNVLHPFFSTARP